MTGAGLTADQWVGVLADAEPPTFGEAVRVLEDRDRTLLPADPVALVEDALDAGVLAEDDGTLRLRETPERESESETDAPPEDGDGDGGAAETWETLLDRAQARAGREWWEPVEEEPLRAVFREAGHAGLLDAGELGRIDRWKRVDLSEEGEEPEEGDIRWYYARGDEPCIEEFRRFHALLTAEAPDDYTPWYFPVKPAGKAPDAHGSWKAETARLTVEEAVERLREGGNVGIAGRPDGPLVNIDVDDDEETSPEDLVETLRAASRSRSGWHAWAFNPEGDIPNLPADHLGEIRTDWQYVVAPGSFVASAAEEIPDGAEDAGYYTVAHEAPVATIDYDGLPEAFREWEEAQDDGPTPPTDAEDVTDFGDGGGGGSGFGGDGGDGGDDGPNFGGGGVGESAVFGIEASVLAEETDSSERWTSLFHGSDTSANMSLSGQGKLQCWRHSVTHGGLQALATLSEHSPSGDAACREMGTGHKHSNAGGCAYKGDWRLIWWAWEYAKGAGHIPDSDPIPYRALLNLAVRDGVVDREDPVERESDDGGTYTGFPDAEAYNAALDHVEEEYGREPGREPMTPGGSEDKDEANAATDPRAVDVVIEPQRAWEAAGRVTPDDLATEADADDGAVGEEEDAGEAEETDSLDLELTDDGRAWRCPDCGGAVDVVRAVAIDRGLVSDCAAPLDADYALAYQAAREDYGAPVPRYLTTADAVAEFDAVLDVIREVGFFHLDRDAMRTTVTGEDGDVSGDAVRTLDPGWRESESGESVLVFESGTIWDADSERSIDALRFAALDGGIIDDPAASLAGSDFTDAYRLLRDEYGAPIPRWHAAQGGTPDQTPMLPAADELVDTPEAVAVERERLQAAREAVQELVADAATHEERPQVVRVLPGLGKSYAAVVNATETPSAYLYGRKELQQQAADRAKEHGISFQILPVLAAEQVVEGVVQAAAGYIRQEGKDALRNPEALYEEIGANEIFVEPDPDEEEEITLDRATCPTANGAHGEAWALAVHTARALDYTPQQMHANATALFGGPLPCQEDEHGDECDCRYSRAWDRVSDPDAPLDLLIGSYVHRNLESVRTHYDRREGTGSIVRSPRAVFEDEYPGDAHAEEFGDEALDHARWLAGSLREDIRDRADLHEADLADDAVVTGWLAGEIEEDNDVVGETTEALRRSQTVLQAITAAEEIIEAIGPDRLHREGLLGPLQTVAEAAAGRDEDVAHDCYRAAMDLAEAYDGMPPEHSAFNVAQWAVREVADPLLQTGPVPALDGTPADLADLPVAGELLELVERAVAAVGANEDDATGLAAAAATALAGGEDGARTLAVWADDGYAHRDAIHLLRAHIAEAEDATVTPRIETSAFAFDPEATDGTYLKRAVTGEEGRTSVLLDRNGHGALLHAPPSRTAGDGSQAPLVGLDATARKRLWSLAVGETVEVRDIHDSLRERAEFLREVMGLQIVQIGDETRAYEGNPDGKDLDGDVALIEEIAEDFAGIAAPRERGGTPTAIGNPAAITTKTVRERLEEDPRLQNIVSAWENYGNLKGSNELREHLLAVILGSQHYGDAAVEKMAALAGEEVTRSGYGAALDYGSDVANTYLKHMREDQVMQAALRFARGDSGATVFTRTSALRPDLPVTGRGDVLRPFSTGATQVAQAWRRLPDGFTVADVAEHVDAVTKKSVRRILAEFADAGYLTRHDPGPGLANTYDAEQTAGAGEVELPDGVEPEGADDTRADHPRLFYTWNKRVASGMTLLDAEERGSPPTIRGAPPSGPPPSGEEAGSPAD